MNKILVVSDNNFKSLQIKKQLLKILKREKFNMNNLIIVIGGDGFMLQTLKKISTLINHFMELILEIMVF